MKKFIILLIIFVPFFSFAHIEDFSTNNKFTSNNNFSEIERNKTEDRRNDIWSENSKSGSFGRRDDSEKSGKDRERIGFFGNKISGEGSTDDNQKNRGFFGWGKKNTHRADIAMRFKMATLHLESFFDRIQARIDKIKADGKDTAVAEGFLASAKTSYAKATTEIEAARTLWNSDDEITTEDKAVIRTHLMAAKVAIIETHTSLHQCIKALKSLYPHSEDDGGENNTDEDNTNDNDSNEDNTNDNEVENSNTTSGN